MTSEIELLQKQIAFLAKFLVVFSVSIALVGCVNNSPHLDTQQSKNNPGDCIGEPPRQTSTALVDVTSLAPNVKVQLAYATPDNFMHEKLYFKWKAAYLQKPVAQQLAKAAQYLAQIKPGFQLLIYDAARPLAVQRKMWDALDSIPPKERVKFVGSPYSKSLHNLGCAVDLTLCDQNSVTLDMGAGFDDPRLIAYPIHEARFLKEGLLSQVQINNRVLLRKVMQHAGFIGIPTEWWHFNACTKKEALNRYQVIETEIPID
jgi:D-alanyl-D-alanine dipeptidase